MTAPLFLLQDINLSLELGVRSDRTRFSDNHTALNLFLVDTAEQQTYTDSFEYQGCQIEIACDEDGDILNAAAWNQIELPAISGEKEGSIQGRIINAVTGEGEEGVSVHLISSETGEEITVETDRYGMYEADAEPGNYTMIILKEGFIQEEREIVIEKEDRKSVV